MRTGLVVFVLILAACSRPVPPGQVPPNETSPGTSPPVTSSVTITSIKIPSLELDDNLTMQVDKNDDGTLGVPPLSAPRMIGWYRQSPVPGDAAVGKYPQAVERAVIVGHINANRVQGAFADLAKVKVGAELDVVRSDAQTATFKVTKVLIIAKSAFPTKTVYGGADGAELVAITCGPGDLDTAQHNYLQQTIVFAKLVSLKPTGP